MLNCLRLVFRLPSSLGGMGFPAHVYSRWFSLCTSMLLFCTAVIWICIVKSNAVTRFTMISVLTLLALVLVVVVKVSWKTIAPLEDTLWTRNVEIAQKARKASLNFFAEGFAYGRRNTMKEELAIPLPATRRAHSNV